MTTRKTFRAATWPVLSAVVLAAAVLLVSAGCGGASKTASSPSPTASPSGVGGAAASLKAYMEQVKPIAQQVDETVKGLPEAVKGISKKPDSTWTTAAGQLDTIASQLGDEADALAALTPPATLQPVQDAGVSALRRVQAAVTKMADDLNNRVATNATRRAKLLATIDELKSQVEAFTSRLSGSLQGLLPSASPTP